MSSLKVLPVLMAARYAETKIVSLPFIATTLPKYRAVSLVSSSLSGVSFAVCVQVVPPSEVTKTYAAPEVRRPVFSG